MPEFEYQANDSEGRPVSGRVEADDVEQAIARLSERGLSVSVKDVVLLVSQEKDELDDAILVDEPAPRLTRRETTELVETVAGLTASDLPLSAGLRAAAEEVPQHRVAVAMRRMAAELDGGASLDAALSHAGKDVPSYLRGLILAGLRTGRVAHVLEELVAMDRERIDLRRRIVGALAYPTFLFAMLLLSFVLANIFIVAPFAKLFDEFEMDLPVLTEMTIVTMHWFERTGLWTVLIALGITLPAALVLMALPKPPDVQRACYRLPIIGPLWRWQSLVDFSRLMHLLLDRDVPLGEAFRLTADGLRWTDLSEVSLACAQEVEEGMSVTDSMAKHREFPASMQPVIASGMKAGQPSEAFAAAAEMYRSRAGVDTGLWEAILPPAIIICVAVGLGFLILTMFLPLIKLIVALT